MSQSGILAPFLAEGKTYFTGNPHTFTGHVSCNPSQISYALHELIHGFGFFIA